MLYYCKHGTEQQKKGEHTRMRKTTFLLFLCLFATLFLKGGVCLAENGKVHEKGNGGLESPPLYQAQDILPAALLESPYHQVQPKVPSEGYFYHFTMDSDFGTYELESLALLKKRVNEIITISQAIASQKDKGDSEFFNALGDTLKGTATTLVGAVTNPIGTVEKIGKGIGGTFKSIATGIKNIDRPSSKYEDPGITNFAIGKEKRQLAADLGLDVYSSNPVVQQFLNKVAEGRAAGKLVGGLALSAVPGAAGIVVSAGSLTASMQSALRDKGPNDLYEYNTNKLKDMGIDRKLIKRFMNNTSLSPRTQTVITGYLEEMEGVEDRGEFIDSLTDINGEEGALFYEQTAELLADYLRNAGRPARLLALSSLPVALIPGKSPGKYSPNKRLVAIIPIDVAYAGGEAITILDGLSTMARETGASTVELIIPGKVTRKAKAQLNKRGFVLRGSL